MILTVQSCPDFWLEADRAWLLALARRLADGRWAALHPIMGAITALEWQRWAYLHFDHHLRQFGV